MPAKKSHHPTRRQTHVLPTTTTAILLNAERAGLCSLRARETEMSTRTTVLQSKSEVKRPEREGQASLCSQKAQPAHSTQWGEEPSDTLSVMASHDHETTEWRAVSEDRHSECLLRGVPLMVTPKQRRWAVRSKKTPLKVSALADPLRLWGACPPNMQSRPFSGVWIAISQGVGQDARRVIQTFA